MSISPTQKKSSMLRISGIMGIGNTFCDGFAKLIQSKGVFLLHQLTQYSRTTAVPKDIYREEIEILEFRTKCVNRYNSHRLRSRKRSTAVIIAEG